MSKEKEVLVRYKASTHKRLKVLAVKLGMTFDELALYLLKNRCI